MRLVYALAGEAELAALFKCAQEMVPPPRTVATYAAAPTMGAKTTS
jgi:hypothetical protein